MANILLVDDEERMLNLLSLYLTGDGHKCEKETCSVKAIEKVYENSYDLVILDVMMPDYDGWEVCRRIREFSKIPIVMLTAKAQYSDISFGLNNGADEYIVKPFDESVLLARINALLRRTTIGEESIVEFKKLVLDEKRFLVYYQGKNIIVTKIEFELLKVFLYNLETIFSREKLIEMVWGYTSHVDSRTVDSHIRNLRNKLKEAGFQVDDYLKSVYGVGYKWLQN